MKSSSGTSPGRLCYYTVNKLLYCTRYLRPGVKSVRKPGLAVSQMCRESTGAPVRSLELPATKELWSQESVSGTGKMTVSVLWMVTLGSFHNTTQATLRFAHEFADTQAAQNLKSANRKQIHNNSNFHFCLNIEILRVYTKYRSCPFFSTRLICRSLTLSHYPGAP